LYNFILLYCDNNKIRFEAQLVQPDYVKILMSQNRLKFTRKIQLKNLQNKTCFFYNTVTERSIVWQSEQRVSVIGV
jgi:hypothetical protein